MKKKIIFVLLLTLFVSVCFISCNQNVGVSSDDTSTEGEETDKEQTDEMADYKMSPLAELKDGAVYEISTFDTEELGGVSLTSDNFGIENNSLVMGELYAKHLSQMWKAHKNSDGTYSFENMSTRLYLTIRDTKNNSDVLKLSVCLEGTNDEAKSWKVYSLNKGEKYVLENVFTTQVATAEYITMTKKTYISSAEYNKGTGQYFVFRELDDGSTEFPRMFVLSGTGANKGNASCPEIIYHDGVYYNYNMTGGISIKTSTDLINWTLQPDHVFSTKPSWLSSVVLNTPLDKIGIWAPGAYKIGDKYFLYYCTSSSESQNSGIGVAVSTDPSKNDWVDQGMVIRSHTGDRYNAIDPNVFIDDDGTAYLIFGSYWEGIFMRKIDSDTGKLDENDTTLYHLARGSHDMEAPYMIKRGDYYYLFVARGGLRKGTYYWAVGRSKSITGPFLDDNGTDLSAGGGTRLTEWKDGIKGAAHAQYFEDKDGNCYMVTESWKERIYDSKGNAVNIDGPYLTIGTIVWTEKGWPVTAIGKNVLSALKK